MGRDVVLAQRRDGRDYSFTGAELSDAGDLVISGHDLGPRVREVFGCGEYEWSATVSRDEVPRLRDALGGDDILDALSARYAADPQFRVVGFLRSHDIDHQFWSWNSD